MMNKDNEMVLIYAGPTRVIATRPELADHYAHDALEMRNEPDSILIFVANDPMKFWKMLDDRVQDLVLLTQRPWIIKHEIGALLNEFTSVRVSLSRIRTSSYTPVEFALTIDSGEIRIDGRDLISVSVGGKPGLSWYLNDLASEDLGYVYLNGNTYVFHNEWESTIGHNFKYEEFVEIRGASYYSSMVDGANCRAFRESFPELVVNEQPYEREDYIVDALDPVSFDTAMALREAIVYINEDNPLWGEDIYSELEWEGVEKSIERTVEDLCMWLTDEYVEEWDGLESRVLFYYWMVDVNARRFADQASQILFGAIRLGKAEYYTEGWDVWVTYDEDYFNEQIRPWLLERSAEALGYRVEERVMNGVLAKIVVKGE